MKTTLIFTLVFAFQTGMILGEVLDGTNGPTISITLESTKLSSKEVLQPVTDQTGYALNPASKTKPALSTEQVIPSPETSEESESSNESTLRIKRQNFGSILGFQEDELVASPEDEDEEEDEDDDEEDDDDYDLGLSDLLDFSGFPIIGSFLSK